MTSAIGKNKTTALFPSFMLSVTVVQFRQVGSFPMLKHPMQIHQRFRSTLSN